MFNPEKLLNMVISEMAGSAPQIMGGKKTKQKKKKKRKAKGISDSLVSSLSSGKGLMTAIALGVGVYEILKSNKNSKSPTGNTIPAPPLPSSSGGQAVPPPLPGQGSGVPAKPSATAQSTPKKADDDLSKLAIRLIEVMIAAAWADGEVDVAEESQILSKFQGQGLDREEKEFLLNALHEPKSIAQLTQGVDDPRVAQTMYSLAVATLVIDTETERKWLDQLARTLSISQEMQKFIEEEM